MSITYFSSNQAGQDRRNIKTNCRVEQMDVRETKLLKNGVSCKNESRSIHKANNLGICDGWGM
jgi:hypothetical protein